MFFHLKIDIRVGLLILYFLTSGLLFSQSPVDTLGFDYNGIQKPNLVSAHHLGLFSARMTQNFKDHAIRKTSFSFEIQSGNVFHPSVQVFLPEDREIRKSFSRTPWFFRVFDFVDQETTPADVMDIEIDAVYKVYRPHLEIPIAGQQELRIGMRIFQTVAGNFFNSPLTNDESIEWFHSNIAGGEDTFGRKVYGLNEVNVFYKDRNGRELRMEDGDLILGGLELTHSYFPTVKSLERQHISLNVQTHIGCNTSSYNRSLDAGFGLNILKQWNIHPRSDLSVGMGYSLLCKNLIDRSSNLDLGTNDFMGSGELMLQWSHRTTYGNYNHIGFNYQNQTSYFKKSEQEYYHLKGAFDAVNQGWHHGYSTLIEHLSSWSFLYTHQRPKMALGFYIKEDLSVNNAPDLETGISVSVPLSF